MPNREIPSIPIDDPEWEPVFDSLTEDLTCIDEGCISFDLVDFNEETNIVTFNATFFNFNADNSDNLVIYLLYTDLARGILPHGHDGLMKIEQFDVVLYPFVALSHGDKGDSKIPEELYLFFEKEISFHLDEGADFYVGFTLVATQDVNTLSMVIDSPKPVYEDGEQEGDDGTGGGGGNGAQRGTPDSSGNTGQNGDEEDNSTQVGDPNGNPPLRSP
ncbi:hypothetical protein KKB99_05985, partial [bacterium]|nr:hypothetical protein [bacterium]MBU1025537.1 hypothetical protein [bacterium]